MRSIRIASTPAMHAQRPANTAVTECLREEQVKIMARRIEPGRTCAEVWSSAARLMSSGSVFAPKACGSAPKSAALAQRNATSTKHEHRRACRKRAANARTPAVVWPLSPAERKRGPLQLFFPGSRRSLQLPRTSVDISPSAPPPSTTGITSHFHRSNPMNTSAVITTANQSSSRPAGNRM